MNETARKLMKRIDDASFAMDDVILYLDTHPNDRNALNYYRYVVALRKEAVKAYEASFGPLTIEDADDAMHMVLAYRALAVGRGGVAYVEI